jgi:hypothetical protein
MTFQLIQSYRVTGNLDSVRSSANRSIHIVRVDISDGVSTSGDTEMGRWMALAQENKSETIRDAYHDTMGHRRHRQQGTTRLDTYYFNDTIVFHYFGLDLTLNQVPKP